MEDRFGAFLDLMPLSGSDGGPLRGLSFAAKDVFDIAGVPTGNGQPTWRQTHPAPERHAAVVAKLLDTGASLAGKTVCDEMCYSLAGDNVHYGAPVNPAAPDRSIGGSSSGSAAAVAGGLVDFALGTDCGGSVRCPASFSGIYGIRPTHGRIDDTGVAPLAGSFDVVGWFARDAALLATVGSVLLEDSPAAPVPERALFPEDAFARLPVGERQAVESAAETWIRDRGLEYETVTLAPAGLDEWFEAFRHLQALEIWKNHGDWVTANRPEFGPGVKERFAYAATLTDDAHGKKHLPVRDAARGRMTSLLAESAIIVMPTAPCSPRRDASSVEVDAFRARTMGLTCPAGLAGLPQISLPLAHADAPLGVSIIGPAGTDEALLALAAEEPFVPVPDRAFGP